jgi:hypothetical protein
MGKVIRKLPLAEAETEDIAYWKAKSPEEKLNELQRLRELQYKLSNERRKGLQRVFRIIKQA